MKIASLPMPGTVSTFWSGRIFLVVASQLRTVWLASRGSTATLSCTSPPSCTNMACVFMG